MLTHDFSRPIPPSTVRISVIHSGECFTLDLPSDRIGARVQALEDHCGPLTDVRCMEVAAAAANDGDTHMVTSAALWLALLQPGGESAVRTGRLAEMVSANGSALLTAMACETSGAWTFKLFAMPRWPTGVAPYRATGRSRRWR
jgi:hypothetical protein